MKSISPPVVTSKRAEKDFLTIQKRHDEIVQGIRTQADRVRQYQGEQQMRSDQERTFADKQMNDRAAASQKNKELDIKKASLYT